MSRRAPTPPPPELLARIKLEIAAPGFLADLTAWADRQCGKLLSIENRIEPHKATDLVNGAIVATCDGVRTWHHEARTLRRHLEQSINSAISNECEKLRRRRHIPLDTTSVDDSQDGASIDVEMSLQREDVRTRPDGLFAQREVRAKVFHALRSHAAGDAGLLAFLDAYEAGHSREGEVVARLNLHDQAFRNVLKRFYRLRTHIPDELHRNVREVMIQDGGAPVATVARRARRVVEIVADEAANDSRDSFGTLDTSDDAGDWAGDSDDGSERGAA